MLTVIIGYEKEKSKMIKTLGLIACLKESCYLLPWKDFGKNRFGGKIKMLTLLYMLTF